MINTHGYAAQDANSPLQPFSFERRDPGPNDVHIEILFCGICHSDLHQARNEWQNTVYPVVPGHEIVGRVISVGSNVQKFQPGEMAGVGCLVDSCRHCPECEDHLEQYCDAAVYTYNGKDKHTGNMTLGGYSNHIVVDQDFVLKISDKLDPAAVAPLLCAGITTYSPMRHWNVKPGDKVGIVGLGGLGHMAVKLAHAFSARTVLFTTSPDKVEDAKRLGADEVVISKNPVAMEKHTASFDFILNTVAAPHNLDPYLALLKRDGTMCMLGVPDSPHPSPSVANLIFKRRCLAGSLIGGLKETQEMLDFCAEHNITSDIELIPIQQVNIAYERMLKSDVKYRFVIDMKSLEPAEETTQTAEAAEMV